MSLRSVIVSIHIAYCEVVMRLAHVPHRQRFIRRRCVTPSSMRSRTPPTRYEMGGERLRSIFKESATMHIKFIPSKKFFPKYAFSPNIEARTT